MIEIIKEPTEEYEIKMLKVWNKLLNYIKENNVNEYYYRIKKFENVGEDSIEIYTEDKQSQYTFTLETYCSRDSKGYFSNYYWGINIRINYWGANESIHKWTIINCFNEKDVMLIYKMIYDKKSYIDIYDAIKQMEEKRNANKDDE